MPMLPPPNIHRPGSKTKPSRAPKPARVMMKSSSPAIQEIADTTDLPGGSGTDAARHIIALSKTVGFNVDQVTALAHQGLFSKIQPPFSPGGRTWSEVYRMYKGCGGDAELTTLSIFAGLAPREIKELHATGQLTKEALRTLVSLRGNR